jgi:hypothetical protein
MEAPPPADKSCNRTRPPPLAYDYQSTTTAAPPARRGVVPRPCLGANARRGRGRRPRHLPVGTLQLRTPTRKRGGRQKTRASKSRPLPPHADTAQIPPPHRGPDPERRAPPLLVRLLARLGFHAAAASRSPRHRDGGECRRLLPALYLLLLLRGARAAKPRNSPSTRRCCCLRAWRRRRAQSPEAFSRRLCLVRAGNAHRGDRHLPFCEFRATALLPFGRWLRFFFPGRFGAPGSSGSLLRCREILSADSAQTLSSCGFVSLPLESGIVLCLVDDMWIGWTFSIVSFFRPISPSNQKRTNTEACGSLLVTVTLLVTHSTFDGRVFIGGG